MGSKKSSTTSRTDLPSWLTDASSMATNLGTRIGSRDYSGYHGRRVANLSGNEQRALNLAAAGNGQAQQYIDKGTNLLKATKSWEDATDAERKAYEEPLFEAITRPALNQANAVYDRQRGNLDTNEAMLSAKGQDQFNLRSMALDRTQNEVTDDLSSQGRFNSYQLAQQQWMQDQNRMVQAADAYRAVGGDLTRLNAQQIQDLMMTGGAERVLEQAGLDFDYNTFLENRDWDVRKLGPLLASLRGTQGHYDTTTTGTQKDKGDPFGQIVGLGATLAGSFYNWGGDGGLGGAKISPQSTYTPMSPIQNTYDPNRWASPGPTRNV